MKTLYIIENISYCEDGSNGANSILACTTCGEKFKDMADIERVSSFSLMIKGAIFLSNHHKCKKRKNIKVGTSVTDLTGSFLGAVRKINNNKKTAFVRDSHTYGKAHKLSELLPIK